MTTYANNVQSESYKWLVLAISTFTFTFVVAVPQMSLPVLFDEISAELGLSLVQVGWIWGIGSVLGILVGLIGGPVGDRFGPRRTLAVACLILGIAGAARGLSNGFTMLALTTLITGLAQWATGLSMSVIGIANVFAPPVGNWLAKFEPGLPFLFWASLVFIGFAGYLFIRKTAAGSTG